MGLWRAGKDAAWFSFIRTLRCCYPRSSLEALLSIRLQEPRNPGHLDYHCPGTKVGPVDLSRGFPSVYFRRALRPVQDRWSQAADAGAASGICHPSMADFSLVFISIRAWDIDHIFFSPRDLLILYFILSIYPELGLVSIFHPMSG